MTNSRRKGADGERECAQYIETVLGLEKGSILRNLSQSRGGGFDLIGLHGYAPEVKRAKEFSEGMLEKHWEQTVKQANGLTPLLFFRADFRTWRCRFSILSGRNDKKLIVESGLREYLLWKFP